ncbi:shikimate dehydrogenase [Aquibacillus rhizosphaerae]|uniref:Shikimate dehydrogenase (NADP(+)) n=1 Tax=Aquibacillus rhizosphaerae TaxID=3051431 RepID=A0ABT7L6J4_9BACI|nr:shikimate dehydrogenase [Aquibacillus sp. LR5S19]MDL4841470.1 shikimate dehydrogenase [Aquibacillus sp. LR5S19]
MRLKLGLIGFPINHSLSPWIHHQFLRKAGIAGDYRLYETSEANLEKTILKLKEDNVNGFNITVPYKQKIMPFLDELDSDAEKIGAVNTVVNDKGKWKGYNTDGFGYVQSVKTAHPDVFKENTKVLILGAGGAARGIYRALVQEKFHTVDIANRTTNKATQLLELKEVQTNTNVLSFEEAEQQLMKYNFIVQTTSVGMKPNIDEQVISLRNISPNTLVSDIVYQPLMTTLLKEAADFGALIHQGHAMLLYQAQLAFEIWTGEQIAAKDILKQLDSRLRGNE